MNIYNRIVGSPFLKNAAVLTMGTTIAQAIPIIIYPILGRLYTPSDFALLASFSSIVSICAVLTTGKYETAVLIAKNKFCAVNVMALSVLLSLVVCTSLFIVFFFCGGFLVDKFRLGIGKWLLLVPVAAFSINIYDCYNEWCVREKLFRKLSINKVTYSVSTSTGKLGLAFLPSNEIGLILGDIIGKAVTACVCFIRVFTTEFDRIKRVRLKYIINQAKRFIKFPIYTMPAQLLNTIGAAVPILLIEYFYGKETLGLYSMTITVLGIPINIISLSLRDVFRQKANELYQKEGSFFNLIKTVFFKLLIVVIVACLLVFYFLPDLFEFVLGSQWRLSGSYAQILLPMIGIDFIAMSLSGSFVVVEKLKSLFVWQVIFCVTTISTVLLGGFLFDDIKYTLILYGAGRFLVYCYMILLSFKFSK